MAPAVFPKKSHHTVRLVSPDSGGTADNGIEDLKKKKKKRKRKKTLHSLNAKPFEMSLLSWRLINVSSHVAHQMGAIWCIGKGFRLGMAEKQACTSCLTSGSQFPLKLGVCV